MTLKTYSADEVAVIFGGLDLNSGAGPDEFLSIEYDEDDFSLQIGVDGEGARSKTNNRSATITVTLMQTSNINAALSAANSADRNTPGGIVHPLLITLLTSLVAGATTDKFVAVTAWIQKSPTRAYGRETGTREWVIRTDKLSAVDGLYKGPEAVPL